MGGGGGGRGGGAVRRGGVIARGIALIGRSCRFQVDDPLGGEQVALVVRHVVPRSIRHLHHIN